jgi:hypothetical protein
VDWYRVVKTINGRRYLYLQKTYRVGCSVKTLNKYVGPYDGSIVGGRTVPRIKHPDLTGAETLPIPFRPRIVSDQPAITHELVSETAGILADSARAATGWHLPWGTRKRAESIVVRDPRVDTLIANLAVNITREKANGAYYRPVTDTINIPPDGYWNGHEGISATSAWHSTFFHELVHWTKQTHRANRARGYSMQNYALEELVAELGAVLLMKAFKIELGDIGISAHYFQSWLRRAGDKDEAIAHATREAEKAVRYILQYAKVTSDDQRSTRRYATNAPAANFRETAAGADRIHDAIDHRAGPPRKDRDGETDQAFKPVVLSAKERREDERIQYGNLKYRIARQKAAVRKAKRKTNGIKALNPFLAQGIKNS